MKKERINLYLNILQGFVTLIFLTLYKTQGNLYCLPNLIHFTANAVSVCCFSANSNEGSKFLILG